MRGIPEATVIILMAEERAELRGLGAFDEDGAPAAAAGADCVAGGGRPGEPSDRTGGWMYNRHGVEVAGALRREAACGSRRNGRAGR